MSYLDSTETNSGPMRYASFQHRLGAFVLDYALLHLTLFIGWLIWSFVAWSKGQTPAKQILKIRVYNSETGSVASWGHMALREALLGWWFGLTWVLILTLILGGGIFMLLWFAIVPLAIIAFYVLEIVFYFTKNCRTLRDLWVKTAVINEA